MSKGRNLVGVLGVREGHIVLLLNVFSRKVVQTSEDEMMVYVSRIGDAMSRIWIYAEDKRNLLIRKLSKRKTLTKENSE